MAWFYFRQSNPGGSYRINEQVSRFVFIEAESAEEANERAIEAGIYFNGVSTGDDCECCSDRWREASDDDATSVEDIKGCGYKAADCRFHPMVGEIFSDIDDANA